MFNVKILCYHQFDYFKPSVVGRTGKTTDELLQWAGRKILPVLFKHRGKNGLIDVVLCDSDGKEIMGQSFKF